MLSKHFGLFLSKKSFNTTFVRSFHIYETQASLHKSQIEVYSIQGELHAPGDGRKIHISPKTLADSFMKNQKYLDKRNNLARVWGADTASITSIHKNFTQKFTDFNEILLLLGESFLKTVKGFQASPLSRKEAESLKDKYKDYCDYCQTNKLKPKTLDEFITASFEAAKQQGFTGDRKDWSEDDIVLFHQSTKLDEGFTLAASSRLINEIEYRDPSGPNAIMTLSHKKTICRFEGFKGYELSKEGKSGVFFTPDLDIQSDVPLKDGMEIHPISLLMSVAVGLGVRQKLTAKSLIINAHKCLLKMGNGEKPTDKEQKDYNTIMDLWNSPNEEDKLFLIKYQLECGDQIAINASLSPMGLWTKESYIMHFDSCKMTIEQIKEGTEVPLCVNGENVCLKVSSLATHNNIKIKAPDNATPMPEETRCINISPEDRSEVKMHCLEITNANATQSSAVQPNL